MVNVLRKSNAHYRLLELSVVLDNSSKPFIRKLQVWLHHFTRPINPQVRYVMNVTSFGGRLGVPIFKRSCGAGARVRIAASNE